MIITFKLFGKKYELETKDAVVTFGGQTINVVYPTQTYAIWGAKIGNNHAPLFYPDCSPVLGNYKKSSGRTENMQLVVDVNTAAVVTDIWSDKKGMYRLQGIIPTRIAPGTTMFK